MQERSVEIQSDKTISAFKEQLMKRHENLGGVSAACIRPYRILDDNTEEYLDNLDEGKSLNGRQRIYDCFADIPVLQRYCVVIQISDRK